MPLLLALLFFGKNVVIIIVILGIIVAITILNTKKLEEMGWDYKGRIKRRRKINSSNRKSINIINR